MAGCLTPVMTLRFVKTREPTEKMGPLGDPLLTQVQLLDDRLITLGSGILEVIKKTAARGNHPEKATTGGVILGVAFEVLGKRGDPLCEVRHLDISAAGVLLVQPECCDFCCIYSRHVFEG